MLRAKVDLGTWTEGQPFCLPGVAVQNSGIDVARAPPHDDPHPIHAAVDHAAAFLRFDIEEELSSIAWRELLPLAPIRNRECLRRDSISFLGG